MSTTLNAMLSTVIVMPRIIGVRASPAERSAPLNMKNRSSPVLNMNMMRRNGSACAFTSGAALTMSSSDGARNSPTGAITNSDMPIAVRNA